MSILDIMSKILLPTDGSEYSLKAATYSIELAKKCGSKVILLHVLDSTQFLDHPIEIGLDARIMVENEKKLKDRGRKALQKTLALFKKAGISVETKFFYGRPHEAIVNLAEKENVDLIVIGSRGLSTLKRAMLGSVADAVSHQATCPVLIVK